MRIWSVKPVQLWFIIQFIGLNLVISLEAVPTAWWFLLPFYKETKLEASVRQAVVDIFCTPLGTEWQSKRPQFKYLRMVFLGFTSTVTVRCVDTNSAHVSFVSYVRRCSSVGIVTGYGLDGLGSIPGRGKIFFSSPQDPDRIWGPPSLLFIGYRKLFPLR
jgi:hypothetical protein